MTRSANNGEKLPVTVILPIKNEARNLSRCLSGLTRAERVVVVDSASTDDSVSIATQAGAEIIQFKYSGGYPKKRQWALDNAAIDTPWTFLLDADEFVPPELWNEMAIALSEESRKDAYFVTKGFHFLGQRFRFGGFSHSAILLFKTGSGRFEKLFDDSAGGLDMEVHERMLVEGRVGSLTIPLIHEDFKGLESYLERHNRYSTWEARLRLYYLATKRYGEDTIVPRLFGNAQERRRFLKTLIIRLPLEAQIWFFYHYFLRLGILHGRPGLIACQIRSAYIRQVRAKLFESRRNATPNDRE